ncbi:MAG TPA: rhomboid family intramembrane serine protease [Phototrophicaceae bacterium]|nr:rhomboid family intramembrane serine protease [Phototrophicaceae bacterium]
MDNPQPEKRRHPLERLPEPPAPEPPPRQRVILHIPSVLPRATYVLIFINVVIFGLMSLSAQLSNQVFSWGANNQTAVLVNGDYYRLVSSMFLHASIYSSLGGFVPTNSLHLIFNMYILYAVGRSLEPLFGHARFLIVYLLGGLTGSVLSILLGGANSYSVGASGAVFAILGAEFIYLYHHRRLMGEAGRARRQSLVTFGITNLLIGLASTIPGSAMRIDNWAHMGGLAGGVILSWFISPILTLENHPDHPGEIRGVDTNPLNRRYWVVSVFATGLVILVFLGGILVRR